MTGVGFLDMLCQNSGGGRIFGFRHQDLTIGQSYDGDSCCETNLQKTRYIAG